MTSNYSKHTEPACCFIVYFATLNTASTAVFIWLPGWLSSQTNSIDHVAMSVSKYKPKLACESDNSELPAGLFFSAYLPIVNPNWEIFFYMIVVL